MRKFKLCATRELVEQAILRLKTDIELMTGDQNPQVVAMRLKLEGKLQAYENVLDAMSGDMVLLRIDAKP